MPYVSTNGIRLAYERVGRGERVLMIMGGYSLADLVADTAGLIEALAARPCRVVVTSLGAWVASALAVARPDLVTCCVLMAVRARVDAVRRALSAGERALTSSGIQLPAVYEASVAALQMFSPATIDDDAAISGWLDIYEMSAARRSAASGQDAIDLDTDRRDTMRAVQVPCRVVGFSDDLICPPRLCAEVAEVIPD